MMKYVAHVCSHQSRNSCSNLSIKESNLHVSDIIYLLIYYMIEAHNA